MGFLDDFKDWFGPDSEGANPTIRAVGRGEYGRGQSHPGTETNRGLTGSLAWLGREVVDPTLDFTFGPGSLGSNVTRGVVEYSPLGHDRPEAPTVDRNTVQFQDAVSSDNRLANRVLGQAANQQKGANYDISSGMLAQLERDRQAMLERRNMAISAAGRGAGAPYNAAIARLNDEIEKAKGQLGRVGPLFDQKSANQRVAWDNADAELQVSADEALSKMDQLNTQTYNALSQTWSDAQSSTAGVLDKIGADDATRAAAAEEVGRFEDEIYEMNEVDAKGRSRILQASEDLAVAMAKSAGADNQLELVRNKIMVESDLKEKINNMLADREQQIKARNAAVSAARDMAAARYPADVPMNREGWASIATDRAISAVMGGASARDKDYMHEILGQFSYAGVSNRDARNIFKERNWEEPSEATLNVLNKYGFSPDTFANIPQSSYRQLNSHIGGVMNTYEHSLSYYDETFANANPETFAPDSAGYALALNEQLIQNGTNPEDARHLAIDIGNNAERGKDTSKFNEIIGWN